MRTQKEGRKRHAEKRKTSVLKEGEKSSFHSVATVSRDPLGRERKGVAQTRRKASEGGERSYISSTGERVSLVERRMGAKRGGKAFQILRKKATVLYHHRSRSQLGEEGLEVRPVLQMGK